jgi:serine/threonine-protein kinase
MGGPAALERCMKSPETEAKLRDDVQLALGLGIQGTPLVIVNGRTSPSLPPFLYALMLAGGRGDHPGFGALPPPRPPTDDHAGHGH